MTIISTIFAALLGNKLIAGLIASGVAIFGAWLHGRSKGKAGERKRQDRERKKVNRKIDKVEDRVAGQSADESRDQLKRWSKK